MEEEKFGSGGVWVQLEKLVLQEAYCSEKNRCSRKGDTQEEAGMYVTGAVSGQGPAPRVHGWADSGEVILSLGQASGTRFLGDERSLGWSCGTDS